jgi:hypothetical protein
VVCKDGSRVATPGKANCKQHGGVDKAATKAAYKARGYQAKPTENQAAPSDTSQPSGGADTSKGNKKEGAGGYQYQGPPTDTTLKAKPGVQTGPSGDSARGMSDSGHAGMSDSAHAGMSDSAHAGMSDSAHAGMSDSAHAGMSDSSQTQR